jgi:hypothetical protein
MGQNVLFAYENDGDDDDDFQNMSLWLLKHEPVTGGVS